MKHETIVGVSDQVPTAFIYSFVMCLLAGLLCWTALFAVMA